MPKEFVFLSFAKYKELVDCTKRSNEIVTGYIKSKKSKQDEIDSESNQKSVAKSSRKRTQAAAKSSHKSKKIKSEDEIKNTDETTQDGHSARTEPLTPSESDESSEEEAF